MSPILLMMAHPDPWAVNAGFICIGLLWLGALLRSQTTRGEGAH